MVGIMEDEIKQQSTSLCMGNQPELDLHKGKKLSYCCPGNVWVKFYCYKMILSDIEGLTYTLLIIIRLN